MASSDVYGESLSPQLLSVIVWQPMYLKMNIIRSSISRLRGINNFTRIQEKSEKEQGEGENMAPPRKIARTDSRELNEDS
ncbi:DET1- and DDB1-associated protein 1 [Dissostichus eleginoides]|uniref:DET1- and DDB1-associated protein 1 n=1 Tax=Dissostichus eleginoides TaxID=100907 RepID=A0AAD9EW58_DISEL|nr:DET1- and DDB1-associated protein 1 [Dissostichus eleginoides]